MSLPDTQQESSPSTRRAKIRTLLHNYEEIPTVPSMVETITALTADVNCSLAALEAAIKTDLVAGNGATPRVRNIHKPPVVRDHHPARCRLGRAD